MNKKTLLLGAHMSASGGLYKSLERGDSIGCTAIQIFTKNNRQWKANPLSKDEIEKYLKLKQNHYVVAHASYLINVGSDNEDVRIKSLNALIEELNRCELLDIPYLILHPGSRQKSSIDNCIDLIAQNIDLALDAVPGKTILLLENTAGMGSSVGHNFEQLSKIINNSKNKRRLGVCFDTCHAFAAGYKFDNENDYEKLWKEFDRLIGLSLLKAMHINDSKKDLGSKVDRHEHIGNGKLGINGFKLLFNDERFFDIPKILETPIEKGEPEEFIPDLKNILSLISEENLKKLNLFELQRYL